MTDTTKATKRKHERPPTTPSGADMFLLISVLIGLTGGVICVIELAERSTSLESANRRIAELESELQALDARLAAAQASPSFSESATRIGVHVLQNPVFVLVVLAVLLGLVGAAAIAVGVIVTDLIRLIVLLATTLFAWTGVVSSVFARAINDVF